LRNESGVWRPDLKRASSIRKWSNLAIGMIRSTLGDPNAWEGSIREFERRDGLQPHTVDDIIFLGSSTFTLWSTMEEDMSPFVVINRGFGGSKMADMPRYFARVVLSHRPRAIVLFAGTNDIAGWRPASPEQVFEGYLQFVGLLKSRLPNTHLYYVAITPTPLRWKHWPAASEANRMILALTAQDPLLHFVDPTPEFIGRDGRPDGSLFRWDRLHPNNKGYALLAQSIKQALEAASASDAYRVQPLRGGT
jgi:lysophospholipase L1-like esterase